MRFLSFSVTNRSSPTALCFPSVAPGTRVEVSCVSTMTLDRPSWCALMPRVAQKYVSH